MRVVIPLVFLVLLSACSGLNPFDRSRGPVDITPDDPAEYKVRPKLRPLAGLFGNRSETRKPSEEARVPSDFDTATDEERAVAAGTVEIGKPLGTTIVSLGNVRDAGFWLETPLVKAPGEARIETMNRADSVTVELRPIEGPATAGSRISLSALRVLGLPLNELTEVRVFLVK